MTETNHSQTIPISPNVFPTKNKKMTHIEKQIRILEDVFSNYPENYKNYKNKNHRYATMEGIQEQLDELGSKVGWIWYVKSAKLEHNNQYFVEMGRFLANVEEPRKSLEEIKQELDKKFEEIIEQYKRNSYASKLTAERKYEDKFDRISYNFQCAVNNGFFPRKLKKAPHERLFGIADCSNVSVNNAITHNYVIKPNAIGVGYYQISSDIQFWMKEKPNFIVRNCAKILLGLIWKDK